MIFPNSTAFGRRIPKQKFYDNLDVSADIKKLFVEQIKTIYWQNKLSPDTLNIAPGENVTEIEVFNIKLSTEDIDPKVLRLMDKQIPYHILFILERPDGKQQLVIDYKEALQSGDNSFKIKQSYSTEWIDPAEQDLQLTALNMDSLYETIVRQIAGDAIADSSPGQSLEDAVQRTQEIQKLEQKIAALQKKIRSEKQLNKQMQLNSELKKLRKELSAYK